MLDFGTKMPSGGNDKDVENNDLFSTLKEEKSSSAAEKFDTAKPLVFDNIPASGAEKIQRVPMPGSKSAASGISLLSRKRGDNLLNDKQEVSRMADTAADGNDLRIQQMDHGNTGSSQMVHIGVKHSLCGGIVFRC